MHPKAEYMKAWRKEQRIKKRKAEGIPYPELDEAELKEMGLVQRGPNRGTPIALNKLRKKELNQTYNKGVTDGSKRGEMHPDPNVPIEKTRLPKPTKDVLLERLAHLERKEMELMEKMVGYRERNRINFFTRPNPAQAKLLKAWHDPMYKVFTFTGANRIGKTTIGAILALSTMFGEYLWMGQDDPQRIIPFQAKASREFGRKVRYVGQDWEKQIKAVVVPELKKWWPKDRPVDIKKNSNGVEAYWTDTTTGSTLEIMSNLQDTDLHEGWSGDLIVYDEPPRRAIRVANARGLIDRQGRELFCMTLLKEAWVDREVINAMDDTGRPDLTVYNVHGDIEVNVGYGITEEGVAQFAKTLTDEEKDARLRGIPSYMSGLVYPQYNRRKHLIDRFEIPLDWIVDIAIDIHPREKQAVLFIATAPTGVRYVIQEIWGHGDGKWVGEQIVRCVKIFSYRVGTVIIDPLSKGDKNNVNTVFDKVALTLLKHEIPLYTASKDKLSGILQVRTHLEGPNKQPSLFIFNDLVRTIFEIEGYMYDKETQNPMDKDDHMMENLYRLILLNTQWEEVMPEAEDYDFNQHGRSAVGGY